jgi:hypothetical protein
MKEIKEDTDISCTGKVLFKMSLILKATYRSNAIPIKIQMMFFTDMEKAILKFVWKHKHITHTHTNPKWIKQS